jgi:hypothetical protein
MNPGGPFLFNTPTASCSALTRHIYATHSMCTRPECLRRAHNISALALGSEDKALVQVSQLTPWWIVPISVPTHPYNCIPHVYVYTVHQLSSLSAPRIRVLSSHTTSCTRPFINRVLCEPGLALAPETTFKPGNVLYKASTQDYRGIHQHQCIPQRHFELPGQRVFWLGLLGCVVDYVLSSIS